MGVGMGVGSGDGGWGMRMGDAEKKKGGNQLTNHSNPFFLFFLKKKNRDFKASQVRTCTVLRRYVCTVRIGIISDGIGSESGT